MLLLLFVMILMISVRGEEIHFEISTANITDFPHHVTLELNGTFQCNGAILSFNYVVTSAQCINDSLVPWLKIRAGTHYFQKDGDLLQVDDYQIFNFGHYEGEEIPINDFAIVHVNDPFKYDQTKQPITLYENQPTDNDVAYVTGWRFNAAKSTRLQVMTVPVFNRKFCSAMNEKEGNLDDGHFCIGIFNKNGLDACPFDLGAPAVIRKRLAGTLSWASKTCPLSPKAEVYTNLAHYKSFIYDASQIF